MELHNQKWAKITCQARQSVDFVKDSDVIIFCRSHEHKYPCCKLPWSIIPYIYHSNLLGYAQCDREMVLRAMSLLKGSPFVVRLKMQMETDCSWNTMRGSCYLSSVFRVKGSKHAFGGRVSRRPAYEKTLGYFFNGIIANIFEGELLSSIEGLTFYALKVHDPSKHSGLHIKMDNKGVAKDLINCLAGNKPDSFFVGSKSGCLLFRSIANRFMIDVTIEHVPRKWNKVSDGVGRAPQNHSLFFIKLGQEIILDGPLIQRSLRLQFMKDRVRTFKGWELKKKNGKKIKNPHLFSRVHILHKKMTPHCLAQMSLPYQEKHASDKVYSETSKVLLELQGNGAARAFFAWKIKHGFHLWWGEMDGIKVQLVPGFGLQEGWVGWEQRPPASMHGPSPQGNNKYGQQPVPATEGFGHTPAAVTAASACPQGGQPVTDAQPAQIHPYEVVSP